MANLKQKSFIFASIALLIRKHHVGQITSQSSLNLPYGKQRHS